MLSKLLTPFTTATAGGTVFRDIFIVVGSIVGLLGLIGVLTPEQVENLKKAVEELSGNWPAIMTAVGLIMTSGMSLYRAVYKSTSNEAAAAAQQVDKIVAGEKKEATIKTPAGVPDIVVSADKK